MTRRAGCAGWGVSASHPSCRERRASVEAPGVLTPAFSPLAPYTLDHTCCLFFLMPHVQSWQGWTAQGIFVLWLVPSASTKWAAHCLSTHMGRLLTKTIPLATLPFSTFNVQFGNCMGGKFLLLFWGYFVRENWNYSNMLKNQKDCIFVCIVSYTKLPLRCLLKGILCVAP